MKVGVLKTYWLEFTTLTSAIVCNVIVWCLALFSFPVDQPVAILHYNVSVGIDFIGEGAQVKVIPIIGSLLLVINVILAYILRGASKRASAMFWSILPIIEGVLLIAFLLILRLNT